MAERPAAELLAEWHDRRVALSSRHQFANFWMSSVLERLARAEEVDRDVLRLRADAWDDGWSMGFTDHRVNSERSDRWMENPFYVTQEADHA